MNVNKARRAINLLSAAALAASLLVRDEVVTMVCVLACLLAALVILYRNLGELSNVSEENPKMKTVRGITLFNVGFILAVVLFAAMLEQGRIVLSDWQMRWFLALIFAVPMVFFGNQAPKIPFNRYTGLRLPWTVRDEETWIVAHRILGYISIPCGLLCLAGVNAVRIETWLTGMLLLWIGIPGTLSGVFFYKKWHGR